MSSKKGRSSNPPSLPSLSFMDNSNKEVSSPTFVSSRTIGRSTSRRTIVSLRQSSNAHAAPLGQYKKDDAPRIITPFQSTATVQPTKRIDKKKEWTCPICTLLNPTTRVLCKVCGNRRPEKDPKLLQDISSSPISVSSSKRPYGRSTFNRATTTSSKKLCVKGHSKRQIGRLAHKTNVDSDVSFDWNKENVSVDDVVDRKIQAKEFPSRTPMSTSTAAFKKSEVTFGNATTTRSISCSQAMAAATSQQDDNGHVRTAVGQSNKKWEPHTNSSIRQRYPSRARTHTSIQDDVHGGNDMEESDMPSDDQSEGSEWDITDSVDDEENTSPLCNKTGTDAIQCKIQQSSKKSLNRPRKSHQSNDNCLPKQGKRKTSKATAPSALSTQNNNTAGITPSQTNSTITLENMKRSQQLERNKSNRAKRNVNLAEYAELPQNDLVTSQQLCYRTVFEKVGNLLGKTHTWD